MLLNYDLSVIVSKHLIKLLAQNLSGKNFKNMRFDSISLIYGTLNPLLCTVCRTDLHSIQCIDLTFNLPGSMHIRAAYNVFKTFSDFHFISNN